METQMQRQDPDLDHNNLNPTPDQPVPGPFKCNVCQRNYSRIDHLARHFRSHTSEKSYQCEVCFKSFMRSDLLKRHAAAHVDSRRHRKSHQSRPGRVSQACKACAQTKLKCKEEKPCQRCETKGIRCEFNELENKNAGSWGEGSSVNEEAPQSEIRTKTAYDMNQRNESSQNVNEGEAMDYMPLNNQTLGGWTPRNAKHVIEHGHGHGMMGDNISMLLPMDEAGSPAALLECDENTFADFLRDVMMPTSLESYEGRGHVHGMDTPSMAFRDLLSFGLESNLELTDQDYTLMDFYQGKSVAQPPPMSAFNGASSRFEPPTPQSDVPAQSSSDLALGTEAFQRSLWCWTPVRQDTGQVEQPNFTLQPEYMSSLATKFAANMHVTSEVFGPEARDKIVAMILSTCDRSSFTKVMSSFPSAELLNNLMQCFLASHMAQSDTWIHLPTLRVSRLRHELLGSFLAAGALLSSSLTIRKLGFAIQESVRLSLPKVCEENNSVTRDLGLLQAFALNLDVGLWSGNKRKIELAESLALVVVTMCRRASRMLRSSYATIIPLESDSGDVLESKWRAWAKQESLKRLIFHLFIRDAQTSISFIVPTIISYSELTLPLPLPRPLFLAPTAQAWKSLYLASDPYAPPTDRIPSLPQCLHDLSPLSAGGGNHRLDTALCLSLIAYGIWGLILEFRNLNSVLKAHPPPDQLHSSSALVIGHRHQELCQLLQHFSVSLFSEPNNNLNPNHPNAQLTPSTTTLQSRLLVSLLLTHLHVSFNDIQLFAGREGEEEAKRVYPSLKAWVQSREARTAVWHAGQVVRYAKMLGGVRDFFAVAVYHASLTFWAYGVLGLRGAGRSGDGEGEDGGLVWLDGEEGEEVKRFVALGRGVLCFSAGNGGDEVAKLSEPGSVMSAIVSVLRGKSGNGIGGDDETQVAPLVENLSQLIRELGGAARAVMGA